MNTDRYHRLSDELLEHMCGKLEELADTTDMKGFDVEYNVCKLSDLGVLFFKKKSKN